MKIYFIHHLKFMIDLQLILDRTHITSAKLPNYYGKRIGKSFGFEGKVRWTAYLVEWHVWIRYGPI